VALLEVEHLRVSFPTPAGEAHAVDDTALRLDAGCMLGMVGESGCGKTMTALALMRLVPPPGRITGGQIAFAGRDLLALSPREMRAVRGAEIAMIFQEPMTALNPVMTVGDQIVEAVRLHRSLTLGAARAHAVEMLRTVDIADPEQRARDYPHQLSGGMRQRVMIAMALACRPKLLIADEPTTALDVTIQAEILDLLRSVQHRFEMALLLVTHDLAVIAERADAVAVMYAGRIVEHGTTEQVLGSPLHPYTRALLQSIPRVGAHRARRLGAIPGIVPDPLHVPRGCRFHDRCAAAITACAVTDPPMVDDGHGHAAACIRAGETDTGGAGVKPAPHEPPVQ
jgi:peptide/nickel transport system ATP-binding protein